MIWKTIVDFPAYEVSNEGLVRSKLSGLRIAAVRNYGFQRVRLIRDGRQHDRRINVIVLEAFVGRRPSLRYRCKFVDGDKTNSKVSNLRWEMRVPPRVPQMTGTKKKKTKKKTTVIKVREARLSPDQSNKPGLLWRSEPIQAMPGDNVTLVFPPITIQKM